MLIGTIMLSLVLRRSCVPLRHQIRHLADEH
jgi:hypothetical protein